jgi:membrane-bound serine protease (ClpP class)
MAPATNLGAATPIRIGGGQTPAGGKEDAKKEPAGPDALERKVVNDSVAWIRGLAQLHGRNAEWAEKAVREGVSLTSAEALDLGVIDALAIDASELLQKIDGRTVRVANIPRTLSTTGVELERFDPDWRLRILSAIANPNIAYILLIAGVYGLLFEALSPGAMVPGVVGAVSLLVGLYALNILDVNIAGGLLLLLGLAFMAAEALTPTFGILGIAGVLTFVAGSIFLFKDAPPEFALSPWVIAIATAMSAGVFAWAAIAGVRELRRPVRSGDAEYDHAIAEVMEWSGQAGWVRFHGEIWRAEGPSGLVEGQRARIARREGLTLFLEPRPAPSIKGEPHAL